MSKIKSLNQLKPITRKVPLYNQVDKSMLVGEDDLPIEITIYSMLSSQFKAAGIELQRNRISATATEIVDPLWNLRQNQLAAARLIAGWSHPDVFGGEYTHELAVKICQDDDLDWIVQQVLAAAEDQQSFFAV